MTFDPANKDHRAYYAEFCQKRTWSKAPVRFILTEDHDNVITMIQQNLAKYHTEKEFGKNTS